MVTKQSIAQQEHC